MVRVCAAHPLLSIVCRAAGGISPILGVAELVLASSLLKTWESVSNPPSMRWQWLPNHEESPIHQPH